MLQFNKSELIHWFSNCNGVLIALSGGVDSCLVAWAARQALPKDKALAIIGDSPSLKRRDLQTAIDFCHDFDIEYRLIYPNEIEDPNYNQNPVDRCFWCKSSLYKNMKALRDSQFPGFTIVNGNNKTDWSDYRPGLKAADQFNVASPLADCNLEKDDIRQIAQLVGLWVWNKPASPCLSSRFPYGESITIDRLWQVEKAEALLAGLGFNDARVRYYGHIAKIEVPLYQISTLKTLETQVADEFAQLGFEKIEVDGEGLVSGKLNRAIGKF